MAHFAILCPGAAGHIIPLGALGSELVRRGHRITIVAPHKAAPIAARLNLPLYGLKTDDIPFSPAILTWLAFSLVGAGPLVHFRDQFGRYAELILGRVPQVLKELAIDGVVTDQILAAGGTAAERVGLPFVTVSTAPPWNEDLALPPAFTPWRYREGPRARLRNRAGYAAWRWFIRPTLKVINRYRKAWALRPFRHIDQSYSPLAHISQLFPELDFPRRACPACLHRVGSLTADRIAADVEFPWERLDGRPLIYASVGTVADPRNRPVYAKISAACADLDAQLVMTRGKWNQDSAGREDSHDLPGAPLVVDFAPQLAMLDRAAVLITHAGLNTTLEAVSRGVPMVALPRSADQPGNAARIEYSGAGLRASFHHSPPAELRRVIERVLTEDTFRRRAQELQQAMRAAGGVQRAAEIAEQALTTYCPGLGAGSGRMSALETRDE